MAIRSRSLARAATAALLCMCAAAACTPAPAGSEQEDADNASFLGGKDDSTWLVEDYSWEAEAVLRLVNDADFDLLHDVVGLSQATAFAIDNTPKPIESLEALDAISHVGPIAFDKLRRVAVELGYGPGLAEEYPPAGEAAAIQDTIDTIGAIMLKRYMSGEMPRNQHAKAHGCVKATLRVEDDLPEALRVGLFESPVEYQAWIRFSNGDSVVKADSQKDVRGMAVKVMGVIGFKTLAEEADADTQDFLLINHPTLMVRNVLDYADFTRRAADKNQLSLLSYFLGLNPADWDLRGLFNLLAMVSHKVASPLESRYWSTTPYLLGAQAVKYSARPCSPETSAIPSNPPDDFLRRALHARLDTGDACFELMVQLQLDPEAMPIEDPTIEWSEEASPFIDVARIEIPQQEFDTPEQNALCEDLSLTPWHALEEHRPLGGINRARKSVYQAMSKMRHDRNGRPRSEPTGW